MMIASWIRLLALTLILSPLPMMGPAAAVAQETGFPGVRGALYESPSYGWTMMLDPAVWTVEEASSADGVDYISVSSSSNDRVVTNISFQTSPGYRNAVDDCLAGVAPEIARMWPGALISPARLGNSGEIIYDMLSDYGQMAAYLVSGIPDYTGEMVVEAFCDSSLQENFIISIMGVIPASQYDEGAELLDRLMFTKFAHYLRTSEPRPDGRPPKIGVLEFQLQCTMSFHFMAEPWNGIGSYHGEYKPPSEPLPNDQAYVLHASWVANIDAIPSVLDLSRLVARFGEDTVRGGDDLVYSPAYHRWLYGVDPETGSATILKPGQSVIYLAWYVVDRLPATDGSGPYSSGLDVSYEPLIGPSIRIGYTTAISGNSHQVWTCGGGGGARPRVSLGN